MEPSLRAADAVLAYQPPLLIALLAIAFVTAWQCVGVLLLAPLVRRSHIPARWSLVVAWLLWMPICGALGLFLSLCGVASAPVLQIGAAVMTAAGVYRLLAVRRTLHASLGPWWVLLPVGVVIGIQLLFAGHPQRMYDQLDYHLVASKRVFDAGGAIPAIFDSHLYIAGPVEYALLWPRAVLNSDLVLVACGQCWVFMASVGTLAGAAYVAAGRQRMRVAAAWCLCAAAPFLVPERDILYVAKPVALLAAGVFVLFVSRLTTRRALPSLVLPFALILTACHPTYLPAAVGTLVVALFGGPSARRRVFTPTPLLALALLVFAVAVTKTMAMTGTPFYPVDAGLIRSPEADHQTLTHWRDTVVLPGETILHRWTGAINVPLLNPGIVAWIAGLLAVTVGLWRVAPTAGRPALAAVAAFLGIFVALWPLSYGSDVPGRYLAPYSGALLALGAIAILRARGAILLVMTAATIVCGLKVTNVHVMAVQLVAWSRGTSLALMTEQFPRVIGSLAVNRVAGVGDLVISDHAAKYFVDAGVLDRELSPSERRHWAALEADPRGAAGDLRLKALIIKRSDRRPGQAGSPELWRINGLWDRLEASGRTVSVGDDLVLFSACYFQADGCAP